MLMSLYVAKDYLVVVGSKDRERFRRFTTGDDLLITKSIPKLADVAGVWAIGPSTNRSLWSSIRKGNRMFFAEKGSNFTRCCTVLFKTTDPHIAIQIWGDSPRMREHGRLVAFSSMQAIDEPFHKTCRLAGLTTAGISASIHPVKGGLKLVAQTRPKRALTGTIITSDDGSAERKTEVVTRLIRDTVKVRRLKDMYRNRCQVCKYAIRISTDTRYSEVHHIHPLGKGGDDDYDNMLVLCPTHHAEFDFNVIGINMDRKTLINRNGDKIGMITMVKGHELHVKNIEFHLGVMADGV